MIFNERILNDQLFFRRDILFVKNTLPINYLSQATVQLLSTLSPSKALQGLPTAAFLGCSKDFSAYSMEKRRQKKK